MTTPTLVTSYTVMNTVSSMSVITNHDTTVTLEQMLPINTLRSIIVLSLTLNSSLPSTPSDTLNSIDIKPLTNMDNTKMIYDGCVKIRTVVTMEGSKDSRSGADEVVEGGRTGGARGSGGPGGASRAGGPREGRGPGGHGEARGPEGPGEAGGAFFFVPASNHHTDDRTAAQTIHEPNLPSTQHFVPIDTTAPHPNMNIGSVAPTVHTHFITPTENVEIVTSAGDILRLLNCGRISFAYAHALNERLIAAPPTAATNH